MAAQVAGRWRHPLAGWLSAVVLYAATRGAKIAVTHFFRCKGLLLSCRGLLLLARRAAILQCFLARQPKPAWRAPAQMRQTGAMETYLGKDAALPKTALLAKGRLGTRHKRDGAQDCGRGLPRCAYAHGRAQRSCSSHLRCHAIPRRTEAKRRRTESTRSYFTRPKSVPVRIQETREGLTHASKGPTGTRQRQKPASPQI